MKPLTCLLTLGVLILSTVPAFAQASDDRFAGGSCHQGICVATYLLDKQVIHQNQLYGEQNTAYKVNVEIRTYKGRSQTPDSTRQATEWVYCSKADPYIAFEAPDEPELVFLSYLNPGGEMNGANSSAHELYWKVCHDRSAGTPAEATALGYRLNLPDGQLVIPKAMFSEDPPASP